MFLGLLKAAGETNKWLTQPIGGEVRPEVQLCMWDTSQTNCMPAGQEFTTCVDVTHASWMLNQGVFSPGFTGAQKDFALAGAQRIDRKSTRLNSSHLGISYAVFCLK